MPFINTKINVPLSREREETVKARLGEAIALIPGKSEQWLMLNFTDNCRLWFRGDASAPTAMVEVELFGSADDADCSRLTARICEIFSAELGISPDRVYVNYTFGTSWGWNGGNF